MRDSVTEDLPSCECLLPPAFSATAKQSGFTESSSESNKECRQGRIVKCVDRVTDRGRDSIAIAYVVDDETLFRRATEFALVHFDKDQWTQEISGGLELIVPTTLIGKHPRLSFILVHTHGRRRHQGQTQYHAMQPREGGVQVGLCDLPQGHEPRAL